MILLVDMRSIEHFARKYASVACSLVPVAISARTFLIEVRIAERNALLCSARLSA